MARLQQAWFLMQMRVNASIDSDLDRVNTEKNPGIKQVREYTTYGQKHLCTVVTMHLQQKRELIVAHFKKVVDVVW